MKMSLNRDREWVVLCLVVLIGAHAGYAQVSSNQLFPFGPTNGDSTLPGCTWCSPNSVSLKIPLIFFNATYNILYPKSDGTIAFSGQEANALTGLCGRHHKNRFGPLIAPFWSFVDTTKDGQVYFRESANDTLISKAEVEVRKGFPDVGRLSLKSFFIITWNKVPPYFYGCPDPKLRNTFQAILTTDGTRTYVIFYYNQLEWTLGTWNPKSSGCVDYDVFPAAVGFTAGVGHPFHEVLGNCTADVLRLAKESNVGEIGKWVFRVDRGFEPPGLNNEINSERSNVIPFFARTTTTTTERTVSRTTVHSPGIDTNKPNINEYKGFKPAGPCETPVIDVRSTRTFVNPLSRSPIISRIDTCWADQLVNSTCVFQFQDVDVSKNELEIQTEIPAVVDTVRSMAFCQLPDLNGHGKLKVELKINNEDVGDPKNYSTTIYITDPKIEIEVHFEANSTDLPIIHLEWSPSIFPPNVTALDVIVLEPQDSKTVQEIKLLSGIPNSGKFSKEVDLSLVSSSVSAIRLTPINGLVFEKNMNEFKSAAISRPFCPEVVRYSDFRSKELVANDRCEEWYETAPGVSTEGLEPCPPKLIQAERDERFSDDPGFYIQRNASHVYRQTVPSPKTGARQQCVYDSAGDLIHAGSGRGTVIGSGLVSHWFNDLHPFCDCCHSSDNCDLYYEKRSSDDGRNYNSPKYASIVGSHHFVTFDGVSYMFNGVGEFWLIQSERFWVQMRMESMASKTASMTSAFVLNDGVTGDIQVEVKGDGSAGMNVLLDGEIIPFPVNSTERISTKSASITKFKSGKMTIVFASGFTFIFEDVAVGAGVRSLNLNASSSVVNLGKLNGLFGHFDEKSENDLMTTNGTIVNFNSTTNRIHSDFGLNWMTTPEDSIFKYTAARTNWSTYSQPEFKPWFKLSRRPTPPRVSIACENSLPCLFDWATTGNLNFAIKTRAAIENFKETLEIMTSHYANEVMSITPTTPTFSSSEIRTLGTNSSPDCDPSQIELNGVTYVKEGCRILLNCTTDTLTNSMEYKRILWTKDELFLFGVNTKYRRNRWSWSTFPAPGVQLSINESNMWNIVLLNASEETTGKYMCAAQPTNKSISEPIFADHFVIVLRQDEIFPPQDTTHFDQMIEDTGEPELKSSWTHDDVHLATEIRLIQAEKEIVELKKQMGEMREELSSGKNVSNLQIGNFEF